MNLCVIGAVAGLVPVSGVSAATSIWTQTATGGNWSTATWTGGAPLEAADTTVEFFAGTSGAASTVTAGFTATNDIKLLGTNATSFDLNVLTLRGTAASAQTVTIGPAAATAAFNFIGASNTITNSAAGSLSYAVQNNIASTGSLSIVQSGAGNVTFSGAITSASGATFSGAGAGTLTLSGNLNGTPTLSNSAISRMTLNMSAGYTGTATISGGRFIVTSDTALGSTSGTLVVNGGTVTYSGLSGGSTRTIAAKVQIGASGTATFVDSVNIQGGSTLRFTNTVDLLGATRTLAADNNANAAVPGSTTTNQPVTFDGVISNGGITKTGRGVLNLGNAANTFADPVTVLDGTLRVNNNAPDNAPGALGNATSAVQLGGTGTGFMATNNINLQIGGAFTVGRAVSVNADNSSGVTSVGANNAIATTATYSNTISLAKNVTLTAITAGATTDFTGNIDDGAGAFGVSTYGAGTVKLSRPAGNSYSGKTTLGGSGALSVPLLANGGDASSIGDSSSAAENVVLAGGTLVYTGADVSTDRLFTVGPNGGTIDASGGAISFTNSGANLSTDPVSRTVNTYNNTTIGNRKTLYGITNTSDLAVGMAVSGTGIQAGTTITGIGVNTVSISADVTATAATTATFSVPGGFDRTLTLTGAAGGSIAGSLSDSAGGKLLIAKTGSGAWALGGDNGYTGATTVSDGTLLVTNTSGSGTGTGNVLVSAAGTLGGGGIINPADGNTVTVDGKIAPGESVGTLTVGSTGSTNNVIFGAGGQLVAEVINDTKDVLAVFGDMTLAGTLDVTFSGAQTLDRYVVATYTGSLAATEFASLVVHNSSDPWEIDYATAGEIAIVVPEPATLGLFGLAGLLLLPRRRSF